MQIPLLSDLSVLYHGTSSFFSKIDLSVCSPNKDFGRGFYATTDYKQAVDFARIKANRSIAGSQKMYVAECSLEKNFDFENLQTLIFPEPSIEWVEFVLANRYPNEFSSPFLDNKLDIVVGPVANMKAGVLFRALLDESYGDPSSIEAKQILITVLNPEALENQIVFCTSESIACIENRDRLKIIDLGSIT